MTDEAAQIRQEFQQEKLPNQQILLQDTPYQTSAFIFKAEQPGTNIMLIGGTHGNEPAGYEAGLRLLQRFTKNPPKSGTIILIPLANRMAVDNFERRVPVPDGVDIEKGNLNRCYPGKAAGYPMEQLSYAIEQLVRENRVSLFIDMHEAMRNHLDTEYEGVQKGLGQTLIYSPNDATTFYLIDLLDAINEKITNPSEKFSALERPVKYSGAWWAGKYLDIAAFTFETSRSLPLATRINLHLFLVDQALKTAGVY